MVLKLRPRRKSDWRSPCSGDNPGLVSAPDDRHRRPTPELLAERDALEAAAPRLAFGVLPHRRAFPLRRARFVVMADALREVAGAGVRLRPRVLDVGIGQAKLERVYQHRHPDAPLSWTGLDLMRYRLDLRLDVPGIARVQADAAALPFADGAFDAVACSYVLQHAPAPASVLRELARVLAPGGACLVAVPNHPQPLKALGELTHPLLVWWQRRRGRRFSYGERLQFWNLPRLARELAAAGLTPARWQGIGFVTGGPLAPLEDRAWWLALNLWAGARAPRLGLDLVCEARK